MRRLFLSSLAVFFLSLVLTPPASHSGNPAGKKFALLIGVNKYDNVKAIGRDGNLNFADNDAEQIARALTSRGAVPGDLVVMTTGKDAKGPLYPRAANIRKHLQLLSSKLKPGDTVLVAFSGYELQYPGSGEYYLCAADADSKNKASMVSLTEVCETLGQSKASGKLILVDACRGLEGSGAGKALPPKVSGKDVAVMFACSAGEFAYEVADKKQGILSYFFCEGLRGAADADKDGKVNWTEMAGYLQTQVPSYAKTKLNVAQRPDLLGAATNADLTDNGSKK